MPISKQEKKVGAILDLFRELSPTDKQKVIGLILKEGVNNTNEMEIRL